MPYLTFIGALIDPPAWLLDLYRSGRCRGISELYELRKLHQSQPEAVAPWIEGRAHVCRADVQAFKEGLPPVAQADPLPPHVPVQPDPAAQPGLAAAQSPRSERLVSEGRTDDLLRYGACIEAGAAG